MVDLGCQDPDWVDGHERDALDAILLRNGLILATLGMDKGKCGYLGAFLVGLGPLGEAPRVTDGGLRVSGYRLGR